MKSPHKLALTLASTVIVAAGLTACGGDGADGDSAPKDASEKEFCAAFQKFSDATSDTDTSDTEAVIKKAKEAVSDLADIGTPKGMPDDARDGYELFIDKVSDIDDDASEDDVAAIGDDLSDDEQKELTAFITYTSTTCTDAG